MTPKIIFLFVCLMGSSQATEFEKFKNVYRQNADMYDLYLSSDFPLSDLGKLHLYGLRMLIDQKLRDEKTLLIDCEKLTEICMFDEYLLDEYERSYVRPLKIN